MILVWVAVFALHGFLRGSVAQIFGVLGCLVGLWVGLGAARWLHEHWVAAQPGWVYTVLRWLVAVTLGLACASLVQGYGERLGEAVRSGPMRWLDRAVGIGVGAAIGLGVTALVVMAALLVPTPRKVAAQLAHSRAASPMMEEAAQVCSLSTRFLPEGAWLEQRFRRAHQRALETRAPRVSKTSQQS